MDDDRDDDSTPRAIGAPAGCGRRSRPGGESREPDVRRRRSPERRDAEIRAAFAQADLREQDLKALIKLARRISARIGATFGNLADAPDDIASHVVLQYLQYYDTAKGVSPASFLGRTILNRYLDLKRNHDARTRAAEQEHFARQVATPPEDGLLASLEADLKAPLHKLLQQLAPKERMALDLQMQGLPVKEISKRLKCTAKGAGTLLSRSRDKLRQLIRERHPAALEAGQLLKELTQLRSAPVEFRRGPWKDTPGTEDSN